MKTVLLTLGRLPKALALARACRAAGCRVLVADPFRWHLCKPSRDVDACFRVPAPNESLEAYLEALLEIVKAEGVDLVLPVSEEALHVVGLQGRLPDTVRLWSSAAEQLAGYHDKADFCAAARDRGLAVPASHRAATAEAAALAARGDYVEKPVHSCSGIGLRFGRAGEPIATPDPRVLVQERVDGEHISSLSVVHEGREIASVFYRGVVFAGTVAICFERVDEPGDAATWVREFIRGSAYTGFLAFDFIVPADGQARAIECNPRATSGVHFFDPRGLGEALLHPGDCRGIALSGHRRYQWAYSTLTEAYAALFRPREFARRFQAMLSSRDVVWEWRDPLPFLLMTPMSWEILWPAMTTRQSLGEATQRDIAWFGSPP